MRPKVKQARRKASKLHGATAGYVSLVDRGANETPFTLVKSKNGASAMSIKKRGKSKAAKSHKTVNRDRKNSPEVETKSETMVAKMIFSADVFESEDDVRDWIKDAEWEAEEITVTKNADGDYEARPNGLTDEDFERLGAVEVEDEGVSAFVGERKVLLTDDEEDDDEDTTTDDETDDEAGTEAKAEEDAAEDEDETGSNVEPEAEATEQKATATPVTKRAAFLQKRKEARQTEKKFDAWDAMFSNGNELVEVIKDAMDYDGVPPGVAEVQFAFNTTIGNILKSDAGGRQDALNKAASEFAEIVGGLDEFFSKYVDMDAAEVEKHVKDADLRDRLAKWADAYADSLEAVAEPVQKSAPVKGTKAEAPEAPAIDYNKISTTVAELVAKAVEPLSQQVEAVTGTVESIASRRPSKKAAGSDDAGTAAPVKSTKANGADKADPEAWARQKQVKGILG